METRDNEFLCKYWNICEAAKDRILPKETYIEKHHIYPLSIYGKNDKTVKLTLPEHYLVHKYLWLGLKEKYGSAHKYTRSMANAFRYMCTTKLGKLVLTPEDYELVRIAHYEANRNIKHGKEFRERASRQTTGSRNPMHGTSLYEVWTKKYGKEIADLKSKEMYEKSMATRKKRGYNIQTLESREKNRLSHLGKKASEKTKEKLKEIHRKRTIEEYKLIAKKRKEARTKNNTLKLSESACKNISEAKKGSKNPMHGRSIYSVWIEKYGEEGAKLKMKIANERNLETRRKNKEKKLNNIS